MKLASSIRCTALPLAYLSRVPQKAVLNLMRYYSRIGTNENNMKIKTWTVLLTTIRKARNHCWDEGHTLAILIVAFNKRHYY